MCQDPSLPCLRRAARRDICNATHTVPVFGYGFFLADGGETLDMREAGEGTDAAEAEEGGAAGVSIAALAVNPSCL